MLLTFVIKAVINDQKHSKSASADKLKKIETKSNS